MKKTTRNSLLDWYQANKRPLPWRTAKSPYEVWISEVMLQQTTSTAVIPYYKAFLRRFPNIKSLASAELEDVYEKWSGLGYYSRARNLHKCAIQLQNSFNGRFPKGHESLLKLPGFGPYTARSVASLTQAESVGVLDGNVIRVMSRFKNKAYSWWEPKVRREMQDEVDSWVIGFDSAQMNQALMELGATICLPKNPRCLLCPLMKNCSARIAQTWEKLPIKKPKKKKELWLWTAQIRKRSGKLYLIENDYAPFMKKSWFPEGKAKQIQKQPQEYDFRHTITHHEIYVRIESNRAKMKNSSRGKWIPLEESRKVAPAALVQKAIQYAVGKKT